MAVVPRQETLMRWLLRLEELALFGASIVVFASLNKAWWIYPALLLAPDLSALGYLGGPRLGALTYNLVHHRGLALLMYGAGSLWSASGLCLAAVIIFGHSSLDRALGYGLKYPDAFAHTHLGWIGRDRAQP
jgi:hypothetical protein